MAQQHTQAARIVVGRDHFLSTTSDNKTTRGMDVENACYQVIVWGTEAHLDAVQERAIDFTIEKSLYDYLSPTEARALAKVLNLAADHSENLSAIFTARRRAQATRAEAAEVAA